jgi:tRNA modification GTPase
MDTSTILARASAPGRGLRSVLRASGPDALALIGVERRGVHALRVAGIPSLAYAMPGPRSFTGEDSFELLVAGNLELVERLERALLARGAELGRACRRAAPGEFSLRAFLNGRIDLTQAEGIAATIAATTDAELAAARGLVSGMLGARVRALADRLARDLALVEAGIDFTDQEDVVAIEPGELRSDLDRLVAEIEGLLGGSGGRESVEGLPTIVLTGPPNAGKSTLFNALLGRARAVAAPIAGTTRDLLVERVRLPGGVDALLVDAAGLDESSAPIDALDATARAAARTAVGEAELVVRCVPTDGPPPRTIGGANELILRTKADLGDSGGGELAVSARTGEGIVALRAALAQRLVTRRAGAEGERVVVQVRHRELLASAADALREARALVDLRGSADPELVAAGLRAALDDLGAITGAIAPDDVLGRIFASFCVGK